MRNLFIILAVLFTGCITRYVVTETASGDPDNPTITRTTEGFTAVPWKEPPVPKSQGKMRARSGNVSSGETDWFDPVSAGTGLHPLYIIGGLIIVAGAAIAIFLKDWVNGGLVCGVGAALIAYVFMVETYPWVMLIIFLIVAGAGAWLVYQMYVRHRGEKTVLTTAEAINRFKEDEPVSWKKLKPYLSSAHRGKVKVQVDKARSQLEKRKRVVSATKKKATKKVAKKSTRRKPAKKSK